MTGGTTTNTGGTTTPNGGATSAGGAPTGGNQGTGGASAVGGTTTASTALVTSASGAYWKTGTWTESTASATVTVNDSSASQKWEGFGGAFNELGWSFLTSADMQTSAMTLLFSATDGANFTWGRIPMGASDYATSRYTLDDTGTDVTPDSSESNRPAADTSLSKFSLDRDGQKLIPYIKAALLVKPDIRFWASPWTPPVWMKTGYKTAAASPPGGNAKKPSYFDGGNMKSDAAILTAYAQYYTKFVQGYKDQGIKIEIVSVGQDHLHDLHRQIPGPGHEHPQCQGHGGYAVESRQWQGHRLRECGSGRCNREWLPLCRGRAVGRARQGEYRHEVRQPSHLGQRAQVRQLPVESLWISQVRGTGSQ
jgi:glucosylceramidase